MSEWACWPASFPSGFHCQGNNELRGCLPPKEREQEVESARFFASSWSVGLGSLWRTSAGVPSADSVCGFAKLMGGDEASGDGRVSSGRLGHVGSFRVTCFTSFKKRVHSF